MSAAPELEHIAPVHTNRLIELASQLDHKPSSLMTKSERIAERKKMLGSYRAYLTEISEGEYAVVIRRVTEDSILNRLSNFILGRKPRLR